MLLPHFIIFLILSLLYAGVIVAWCINWNMHKKHARIPLHWFIGITLASQCLVMILLTLFFGIVEDLDSISNGTYSLAVIADGLSCVAEGIFYSLLILIALGWCIVVTKIEKKHAINIAVFITIYVFLQVFSLFTYGWLYVLIALVVLCMYIGLMYYVFGFTQANIKRLTRDVQGESDANSVPLESTTSNPPQPPHPASYPSHPSSTVHPQAPYPAPQATYYPQPPSTYPPPQAYPTQPYPPQSYPPSQPYPPPSSSSFPSAPYPQPSSTHSSTPSTSNNQPAVFVDTSNNNSTPATTTQNENERIPEAQEKLNMFRLFYKFMMAYIIITLILSFGLALFGVGGLISSSLRLYFIFSFLSGICYVFRLRDFNQYFYLVLSDNI